MLNPKISIESLQNPRIKSLVKLRKSSERMARKETLIEGCREVERAIMGDYPIHEFYICSSQLNPTTSSLMTLDLSHQYTLTIFKMAFIPEYSTILVILCTIL